MWVVVWRWLRFPLAIVAALGVIAIAGVAWLLSGQRYQILLTQQLNQLLKADVRVAASRFSFTGGVGIELDGVTIRVPTEESPFLTAAHIELLLDVSALLQGQLLFHRINSVRPHLRLTASGGGLTAFLRGLFAVTRTTMSTPVDAEVWFAPILAVRQVTFSDGEVEYLPAGAASGIFLSHVTTAFAHSDSGAVSIWGQAMIGRKGELGTVKLRVTTPVWDEDTPLQQVVWRGTVTTEGVAVHELGQLFGMALPSALLHADLLYEGSSGGPVTLSGDLHVHDARLAALQLQTVSLQVKTLQLANIQEIAASPSWASFVRTTTGHLQIKKIAGVIGAEDLRLTLTQGTLTLSGGILAAKGLSGHYGVKSHIAGGEASFSYVATDRPPEFNLLLHSEIALQEDLLSLLAVLRKAAVPDLRKYIAYPRGKATVMLSLHAPRFPESLAMETVIELQRATFPLRGTQQSVTNVTGTLHLTNTQLRTEALSFHIGGSAFRMAGRVSDYVSSRRQANVQLTGTLALAELFEIEETLRRFLGTAHQAHTTRLSDVITSLRGQAEMRVDVRTAEPPHDVSVAGEITFQQAALRVPHWNIDVDRLLGTVQIEKESLTTDALSFRLGTASLQVQGFLSEYQTPQRHGELQIAFTGLPDTLLVPLLPSQLLHPRGGIVDGKVAVSVRETGHLDTTGEIDLVNLLIDPLPKVFRPFAINNGQLTWRGESGEFTVRQGSSPGGTFSGQGRFRSLSPLHLELTVDFPALDLDAAINREPYPTAEHAPKDETVIVQAGISAARLQYKTFNAMEVQGACFWHGRQADLRINKAKTAGGVLQGTATLWSDHGALYLEPQVTKVELPLALSALGIPNDVLSGNLDGDGSIYLRDWRAWGNLAQWEARLSLALADGAARRIPMLVRLWSALTLQDLLSFQLPSLPGERLAFTTLTGDFTLGGGVAVTKNTVLNGTAVRIDVSGITDLTHQTVELTTAVMPLHGITSSVAKIPLAGELLARGAEKLIALPFRVSGPYHDPTVTPLLVNLGQR